MLILLELMMNNVFFPQVNFCFTNEATEEVYAEYFAKREEELEAIGVDDDYTNMLYRTAGAAAFGAAAGAALGAGAAAFGAAATGAAAFPFSSTVTSYAVPLTVIV